MLECDRIDGFEGIYVKRINSSCMCIFSHCWYFIEINFRFQSKAYDGCHDLMQ